MPEISGLDSGFCSSIRRTQDHPSTILASPGHASCAVGDSMAAKPAPDLLSPRATVTSCEVWLVCGCGNSPVWFETEMSCIVLPTDGGLLRNVNVSLCSGRS